MSALRPAHHEPGVKDARTAFLLAPRHRLFVVFDDPSAGAAVASALRGEGAQDDVWTFVGDNGLASLDPHVRHHGLGVGIVRVVQRVLTNDCEYCEGLSNALEEGAMVLAIRVDADKLDALTARLAARGGHTFAYGAHGNFVPVAHAAHAVGFFTEEHEEVEH